MSIGSGEVQSSDQPRRELLAGHEGVCKGFRRTEDFGHARDPFTWLSSSDLNGDVAGLARELQASKKTHDPLRFEAWEAEDAGWVMVLGGDVLVLYAEVDERLTKVRAILQWADGAPEIVVPPGSKGEQTAGQ